MTLSTYICLCGMLACLAALAAMKARRICRDVWRSFAGRRGVFAALAILAAVCSIVAQKPSPDTPTITVDALLRDAGCYATNDVFHAAVSNAPAYAAIDFSACPVLVYARERGLTGAADWFELTPRRTFGGLPADYAIANATNYNYLVYLDYVPPSPVHTNGVFELHGFVIPGYEPGNLEQLAAGFINSRAIPPPYDAEVEYLQSTGTQWIDTGIVPDNSTSVFCDFIGVFNNSRLFGARGTRMGDRQFECILYDTGMCGMILRIADSQNYLYKSSNYDQRFSISMNSSRAIVNGTTVAFSGASNFQVPCTMVLFAGNFNGSVSNCCKAKVYVFQIWQNGVLVRDYIAVRKGTVGYLYDKVSGQLFGNAGTGAFGVGPDK